MTQNPGFKKKPGFKKVSYNNLTQTLYTNRFSMTHRHETIIAGQYYHLYNRGVNRQPIFCGQENWIYFLQKLRAYFQPDLAEIVAYCLMPNHYHILFYAKTDDIGKHIIHPLTVSYSKSFNRYNGRTGPLFEGSYKTILIDKDEYLIHLSKYIHLNPVTARLVSQPEDWLFSSYRDFAGLRKGTLCYPEVILGQFRFKEEYADFVKAEQKMDSNLARLLLE
jgi:putative transposase